MSVPSKTPDPWAEPLKAEELRLLAVGSVRPEKRFLRVASTGGERPLELRLYRFPGEGPPVLLVHGASAWSASFTAPPGHSLVEALRKHRPDVDIYLLDWRGGRNVVMDHREPSLAPAFTWDAAATVDIPAALREIQRVRGNDDRPAVLGHCVGGGILSMAISAMSPAEPYFPSRVVLSTLGLFHVQPWDGLLRASDFILERVTAEDPAATFIHPKVATYPWPQQLAEAWELWPKAMLPDENETFRRLAFMFGRIAIWDRLYPAMKTDRMMLDQFGAMHMTAYLQAGQMVRRGFADPLNAPERLGRGRTSRLEELYLKPRHHWRAPRLRAVTLITGDENDLWHRDAIDRMGEWLTQIRGPGGVDKHVLRGWAHQDLLWGEPDSDHDARPLTHYVRGLLGA